MTIYFNQFLTEKWTGTTNTKEEAYKNFRRALTSHNIASASTIKKWFGIGGESKPDREQIFELAFALQLSPEEFESYLIDGLEMPGVQINDYRELIFLYSLGQKTTYKNAISMIETFEIYLNQTSVWKKHTETEELWQQFYIWNNLEPKEFLREICNNADLFKGYSNTVLSYFIELRNFILDYVRAESSKQLQHILTTINFYQWANTQNIPETDYPEEIYKYLTRIKRHKKPLLSKEDFAEAMNLYQIVYSDYRNTDLISELYASAIQKRKTDNGKRIVFKSSHTLPFHMMSIGYLSNLLNISDLKAQEMNFAKALTILRNSPPNEVAPEWICQLANCSSQTSCAKVYDTVLALWKKAKKRCRPIQREDLLTLIHFVAQTQYYSTLTKQKTYQKVAAINQFKELANVTLTACHMAPLNEKYATDNFFLSSFQDEEMYSLSDLIDSNLF